MANSEAEGEDTDGNDLLDGDENFIKKYETKESPSPKTTLTTNNIIRRLKVSTPISILIESLVKNLCSVYESDNEKATLMYNIICEKLYKMNMIDESYNMDEFEGMRIEYQKAFHHLLRNSSNSDKVATIRPAWPPNDFVHSHYHQEFDEIEYIAGGGFGQVYRVKHKLDGTEYAVKKIPIRSQGIESVRNYLSEVKTFASVNHANVVQYKAAWLELGAPTSSLVVKDNDSSSSIITNSYYNNYYNHHHHHHHHTNKIEEIKHHIDDDYIYHQDEFNSFSDDNNFIDDTSASDFEVNFEHSISSIIHSQPNNIKKLNKKREKRDSISEGGKAICKLDINKELKQLKEKNEMNNNKWATLYIQMALCQSTLKQWLEKRNNSENFDKNNLLLPLSGHVRNKTIMEILKQLLKGLEYIHSKGIVHHDIKPSNIFIQLENDNLLVQLGDFGLACPLQNVQHSLAFGTKLYAAPEQLAGKCDPKSDMYSLGIVLFELVEHFRTDMERVRYITDLRKGILPSWIQNQNPQLYQIITKLVMKYPDERPDASTLLKSITDNDVYKEIQELRCQVAEKNEEILRLKELLKSVGVKSI